MSYNNNYPGRPEPYGGNPYGNGSGAPQDPYGNPLGGGRPEPFAGGSFGRPDPSSNGSGFVPFNGGANPYGQPQGGFVPFGSNQGFPSLFFYFSI